jgi:hypothetical protein
VATSPSYYGESVIGSVGGTFFNSIFRPQPKSDPSMSNGDGDPSPDSNRSVIRLKQVPGDLLFLFISFLRSQRR